MSPEQVLGRALDPASDVFSLGVILFEMLTGRHPHGGGSSEDLMQRIATAEPMRPRVADASVDRVLELILLKALARAPADRHRTAGALADDLARWRRGERPSAGGTWAWAPYLSRRWLRSHRVLAWTLGVSLVLSTAALVWNQQAQLGQRRFASATFLRAARVERDESGRPWLGLAYLALAVQREPANRAATTEVCSQLVRTRGNVAPWAAAPALEHRERVGQATFSADGRRMVTVSLDGTAQVWEAATGHPVGAPMRHDGPVVAAVFSPDGKVVATASNDRVTVAKFSPDGRWLLTVCEKSVQLWDAATGQSAGSPLQHPAAVQAANFSPDSARLVTACEDANAVVWDLRPGGEAEKVGAPLLHRSGVLDARFSADACLIYNPTAPNGCSYPQNARPRASRCSKRATTAARGSASCAGRSPIRARARSLRTAP